MRNFSRARGRSHAPLLARTFLSLGFFVLGALPACVDPTVDPSRVTARIISVGEYSVGEGIPVFIQARTKIPCEIGRVFGVDYALDVEGGANGAIPVLFRWVHPEMQVEGSPRPGTETVGGGPNPVIPRGQSELSGRSLWSIDREDERISGLYRFEIRFVDDRKLLLAQDFQVDEC